MTCCCFLTDTMNVKISDLLPNTVYMVKVAGKNLAGISEYSDPFEVKTLEPTGKDTVKC